MPRYTVDTPIAESAKICSTHGAKKLIGYDEQQTFEFTPPKLQVARHALREAVSQTLLADGDNIYARAVAQRILDWKSTDVREVTRVTEFGQRYPNVFKRLPVAKLAYQGPGL